MKTCSARRFVGLGAILWALASGPAVWAQSEASAISTLSALPVASVVGASAGAVVVLPVALSTAGAVLVVKAVEVTAHATVYVLERVSDGAVASVQIVGKGAGVASVAVGTMVTVSAIGPGVVLSTAGQVIAFIPNEVGVALLHNERVTR